MTHSTSSKNTPARANPNAETFMEELDHPLKQEIQALRIIICGAHADIQENVKWAAPNFFLGVDFATMKLRPTHTVQLVLHTGAKVRPESRPIVIEDPNHRLKWLAPDRAVLSFRTLAEIEDGKEDLQRLIRQWIAALPQKGS